MVTSAINSYLAVQGRKFYISGKYCTESEYVVCILESTGNYYIVVDLRYEYNYQLLLPRLHWEAL